MSISFGNSNRTWAGLLIDTPRRAKDEHTLREVLGSDSVLLLIRDSDSAVDSVRRILQSRASSILTVMGDEHAPLLAPLLRIAGSLSSLRRIVVLHDASSEASEAFRQRGILMLRDCPEMRAALGDLVAKESGLLVRPAGKAEEMPPPALPFAAHVSETPVHPAARSHAAGANHQSTRVQSNGSPLRIRWIPA